MVYVVSEENNIFTWNLSTPNEIVNIESEGSPNYVSIRPQRENVILLTEGGLIYSFKKNSKSFNFHSKI